MNNATSATFTEDLSAVVLEDTSMNFMEDVEYEFVGGGTAVNNL